MLYPIKVLDVEISRPIPSFYELGKYTAIRFLVRLYGRPVGYVSLPVENGSVSADKLKEAIIAKHSYTIIKTCVYNALCGPVPLSEALQLQLLFHQEPVNRQLQNPFVTVIVCTRNRTSDLVLCLNALMNLRYPHLEIVVVDNAPSDDATEKLVKSSFPSVRYVYEPRPGLDWARNQGIMEAKGEIVAYTDDDVIVDEGWIDALATLFGENKDVMTATGLVVPFEMETKAQVLFEQYGGFGRGFYRRWIRVVNRKPHWGYLGTGQFGTGANMAFRKAIFEKVGMFDPALDVGTVTNGGGDLEMLFRVMVEGGTLMYEPEAVVRHRHRREYEKLKEQIKNNGKGLFSYFSRSLHTYPKLKLSFIRLTYWWAVYWIGKRFLKTFIRPNFIPRDLILAELKGCFNSLGLYNKARKRAVEIAAQFGDAADVNVDRPKGESSVSSQVSFSKLPVGKYAINIQEPLQPLAGMEDFAKVIISVCKNKSLIGKVVITNNFKPISSSCVADAIANKLSEKLLLAFNPQLTIKNNKDLTTLLKTNYHLFKNNTKDTRLHKDA